MRKLHPIFRLWIPLIGLMLNTEASPVLAQDFNHHGNAQSFLFDLGLGIAGDGAHSTLPILSVGGNYAYQYGVNLFSVRGIYNSEIDLIGFGGGANPKESVWDVGLLYGLSANAAHGSASLSAGISLVGGMRRGRFLRYSGEWFGTSYYYEKRTFFTVGFPVESRLFWTPSSAFGIGICGFADFNNEKSFVGGQLCIRFISQK